MRMFVSQGYWVSVSYVLTESKTKWLEIDAEVFEGYRDKSNLSFYQKFTPRMI